MIRKIIQNIKNRYLAHPLGISELIEKYQKGEKWRLPDHYRISLNRLEGLLKLNEKLLDLQSRVNNLPDSAESLERWDLERFKLMKKHKALEESKLFKLLAIRNGREYKYLFPGNMLPEEERERIETLKYHRVIVKLIPIVRQQGRSQIDMPLLLQLGEEKNAKMIFTSQKRFYRKLAKDYEIHLNQTGDINKAIRILKRRYLPNKKFEYRELKFLKQQLTDRKHMMKGGWATAMAVRAIKNLFPGVPIRNVLR